MVKLLIEMAARLKNQCSSQLSRSDALNAHSVCLTEDLECTVNEKDGYLTYLIDSPKTKVEFFNWMVLGCDSPIWNIVCRNCAAEVQCAFNDSTAVGLPSMYWQFSEEQRKYCSGNSLFHVNFNLATFIHRLTNTIFLTSKASHSGKGKYIAEHVRILQSIKNIGSVIWANYDCVVY